MADLKQKLRRLAETAKGEAKAVMDRLSHKAKSAGASGLELGRNIYGEASGLVSSAVGSADETYRRVLGEDESEILASCPVALEILAQEKAYTEDPDVMGTLLSAKFRPVIGAAILGGAGVGMLASDEVLSKITRSIFDGKDLFGGWAQVLKHTLETATA